MSKKVNIDKKVITKLLAESKLSLAIHILLVHFNNCESNTKETNTHTELILISGRCNDLEAKIETGKLEYTIFIKLKTEITKSVLEILWNIPCENCEFHNTDSDKCASNEVDKLNLNKNQKSIFNKYILNLLNTNSLSLTEKQKKIITEFVSVNFGI